MKKLRLQIRFFPTILFIICFLICYFLIKITINKDVYKDLSRCKTLSPGLKKPTKHGIRSTRLLFAELSINGQLLIGHSHIDFVKLSHLSVVRQRLEFSGRRSFVDLFERTKLKLTRTVQYKRPKLYKKNITLKEPNRLKIIVKTLITSSRFC